jgi:predicted O-linked N-acetylglucosamine transferase (SPINDLY family)
MSGADVRKEADVAASMARAEELLIRSARLTTTEQDDATIRELLDKGVDWSTFAEKVVAHGVAPLAGNTLDRVAPDLVPGDILDALLINRNQARIQNRSALEEVTKTISALSDSGVKAMAFRGPAFAVSAYGDTGLRTLGTPSFLVRRTDYRAALGALSAFGYTRNAELTETQCDLVQRLDGRESLRKRNSSQTIEVQTRLAPMAVAVDIDFAGLWQRLRLTPVMGRMLPMLSPADMFIALSVYGTTGIWRHIKWACDVVALVDSHPAMDWSEVASRARAQGCLRMVSFAALLAHEGFLACVPDEITLPARGDPRLESLVRRVAFNWKRYNSVEPAAGSVALQDTSLLHDGLIRRVSHIVRTKLLPTEDEMTSIASTGSLTFDFMRAALRTTSPRAKNVVAPEKEPIREEDAPTSERYELGAAAAQKLLQREPTNAFAWRRLGDANFGLKRFKEAIDCYDKSLRFTPNHRPLWRRRQEAIAALGTTIDLPETVTNPQTAEDWTVRAGWLSFSRRYVEAVDASDRALALDPDNRHALRIGMQSRLRSCDWSRREHDRQLVRSGLQSDFCPLVSTEHMSLSDSEADNLLAARYVAKRFWPVSPPLWRGERYRHDRIRLAYMSSDFNTHPVSSLMVGVFENHDRRHFEVTAISLGHDDGSAIRRRLETAFDHFVDAHQMTDRDIGATIRGAEIDILVDLNAYTSSQRTEVLACRPAPTQVNFQGFPGTMALPYMDYIIADRFVIPEENRIYFTEKIAYLPHAYQPNDSKRAISSHTPSRAEAGLPDIGFVFACLNNPYKLSPEIFHIWMRLLGAVEGSVLWLQGDKSATLNLRREAKERGINPERLLFAPYVASHADHLARQRLIDLFLDSWPYNAHTTASDALWAGVPVLTYAGNTFPSRVGMSLLHAIGLPELVTTSLESYEDLALALAKDPLTLREIRAKLQRNRNTMPLFDTRRSTLDLEAAYITMWERQRAGRAPETFLVAPQPMASASTSAGN